MQEIWVRSLGQEDPLEKEMATHGVTKKPDMTERLNADVQSALRSQMQKPPLLLRAWSEDSRESMVLGKGERDSKEKKHSSSRKSMNASMEA